MSSIRQLLLQASSRLKGISDTPRLDAELLLQEVLACGKEQLIIRAKEPLTEEQIQSFETLLQRRKSYEPVAYILGRKEFYGRSFSVDARVLVPRPETELLIEKVLDLLPAYQSPVRVLDLGTGSGCIAITLVLESRSPLHLTAVERSSDALELARANADSLGVRQEVEFIQSNWFEKLGDRKFDIIVSNPPYVESELEQVGREISFEPSAALFSGSDGLDDIRYILANAPDYLDAQGVLLFEHGSSQGDAIVDLIAAQKTNPMRTELLYDLAGLPRAHLLTY